MMGCFLGCSAAAETTTFSPFARREHRAARLTRQFDSNSRRGRLRAATKFGSKGRVGDRFQVPLISVIHRFSALKNKQSLVTRKAGISKHCAIVAFANCAQHGVCRALKFAVWIRGDQRMAAIVHPTPDRPAGINTSRRMIVNLKFPVGQQSMSQSNHWVSVAPVAGFLPVDIFDVNHLETPGRALEVGKPLYQKNVAHAARYIRVNNRIKFHLRPLSVGQLCQQHQYNTSN